LQRKHLWTRGSRWEHYTKMRPNSL
jgi:hypothetical protein